MKIYGGNFKRMLRDKAPSCKSIPSSAVQEKQNLMDEGDYLSWRERSNRLKWASVQKLWTILPVADSSLTDLKKFGKTEFSFWPIWWANNKSEPRLKWIAALFLNRFKLKNVIMVWRLCYFWWPLKPWMDRLMYICLTSCNLTCPPDLSDLMIIFFYCYDVQDGPERRLGLFSCSS